MATCSLILLCFLATSYTNVLGDDNQEFGVCYGFNGNNLPSPRSGIALVLGVKNEDIPTLASSQQAAEQWFNTYVQPYVNDVTIRLIAVGNEVVPGQYSDGIVPAMQNLQNVIHNHGIGNLAPLLVNLYPYFAYASDPAHVRLDYAQFTASQPVVQDGNLAYMSLFKAMFDCFVWAMEKIGVSDVDLVVQLTTVHLARTYNKNFLDHLLNHAGSPKRPLVYIEGFVFSVVDENLKSAGVEQAFGMFQPNLQPNYNIFS
ncbi:hypothetical protein RND81_07G065400 [Saponaria officinalis]|uniref:Glucan endo-1,3-beta-D-glucosidase n=1 Tax=Saponaria officinalis TaxID=3572 RepID=A0AAW1JN31_SAPOF